MTLEYTYDTYASNYVIKQEVVNYIHDNNVRNDLIAISIILIKRIGLNDATGIGTFFVLYNVTNDEHHAAFFFLKENSPSSVTDIDIYRVECQIELVGTDLQITGCKAYYTPAHFARQNITVARIGGEDSILSVGVCGRAPIIPEEDWTPILLSGFNYDSTNGLSSENTYILTPPKSFFVEGEHVDFAPVGKYRLEFCEEC